MGAVLECCGGPSADDYDTTFHKISPPRYHPLLGRCDEVEKSLLHKLQRSISTSWSTRLMMGDSLKSPHGLSHVSSRYGLDEHYESESDSDEEPSSGGRGAGSVTSATSGSRLLCDFYNLVLECDHSKFFVDANGRRVKGAYLTQVEILEDYFDTTRRTTVGSRRRRRSSLEILPYQPPQKLKHLASNPNYDRSSNMSLMSNDTSQTMASESDYWATFMDKPDDPIDFVTEMTFPPKFTGHQQLTPHSVGRSRRDSADRRRSWVQYEQQLYGSSFDGTTSTSLLLFSPVNANSMNETTTSSSYQRSLSRGTVPTPHDKTVAMPIEGSRYNLWDASIDDDSGMKPVKTTAVPAAFSNATVTERRRASLTMGNTTTNTTNGKRRLSVHSIAPIAV